MNVGAVKKIIILFKQHFETIDHSLSHHLSQLLLDLFNDLDEKTPVNNTLGIQVKKIIEIFWAHARTLPIYPDWECNDVVSCWLKLQQDLLKTEWDIQTAHHAYFYYCLKHQYNQSGNSPLQADQLMPVFMKLCRMLKYWDKTDPSDYPFSYLRKKIDRIEKTGQLYLVDELKAIATAFTGLFYLLYHHCSAHQIALWPRLIQYRTQTTSEEIRSESAVFAALVYQPHDVLSFIKHLKNYVDGREFHEQNTLAHLRDLMPNTKTQLLEATLKKGWYYEFRKEFFMQETDSGKEKFIAILDKYFNEQEDTSYSAAQDFVKKVNQAFENQPPSVQTQLISATYFFSLSQYIKLCQNNRSRHHLFWFSPSLKAQAAHKLQQREQEQAAHFSIWEWAATKEGRLSGLVTLFDYYKNEHSQRINNQGF